MGDDAVETKQRDSASTKAWFMPWPWHSLPKISMSPGARGPIPLLGTLEAQILWWHVLMTRWDGQMLRWGQRGQRAAGRPDPAPGSVHSVALVCSM